MTFRHGKGTRVLVNTTDLSAFFRDSSLSATVATSETTTYGVTGDAKTYVAGLNDATVALSGLFDGDTGAVDDILTGVLGSSTDVVFTVAQDGGLTVGRRCYLGQAIETKYNITSPVADVVQSTADLQTDGGSALGVVLAAAASVNATGNQTSVDNGAASSNGGQATLHVTANTRDGNVVVKVQHSADNSSWADLVTFATVGSSTKTSERVALASGITVNRYLRASYTVAGTTGSATLTVAFGRR